MKKCLMAVAVVALACSMVQGQEWSLSLGSDYETVAFTAVFSPDPNGGIGIMAVTDSFIPEDTDDNVAIGPYVQFNLGDLVASVADRIIPGDWPSLENVPARLYGTLGFLWGVEGDNNFIFAPGTKTVFFPNWKIRPCLRNTYFKPEDDSGVDEDFKTMLEFDYVF